MIRQGGQGQEVAQIPRCIAVQQVWQKLGLARNDRLPGISITPQPLNSFVPVRIAPPARPTPADCQPSSSPPVPDMRPVSSRRRTSVVEVVLGKGRMLKVDESIDPVAFARLVAVLDGGNT